MCRLRAVEVDGGSPRRARLKVIEGFGKGEIHAFVSAAPVAPNTRLVTDDWPSYNDIPDIKHKAITVGPMAAHIVLPWTHRLFSNLKRWGLGVYHGLRKTNLQHYLDEFVFRFNRRRTRHAAFNTLLGIGARTVPAPYRLLIRKTVGKAAPDYTAYSPTGTSCRSGISRISQKTYIFLFLK